MPAVTPPNPLTDAPLRGETLMFRANSDVMFEPEAKLYKISWKW